MLRNTFVKVSLFLFLSLPISLASADTVDVSGTWQLTVLDTGRTFTPVFVFSQEGEILTGTYRNSQGDNPAKGTVNGNEVTMSGEITGRDGNKRWVTYTGVVKGDTMSGKFQTSRADVNFTAKRESK